MIGELSIAAVLFLAGMGALAPLGNRIPRVGRAWLAFPTGAAIYLLAVPLLIITTGTLDPIVALVLTGAVGAIGVVLGWRSGSFGGTSVAASLIGLAVTVGVVLFTRSVHLTRLSPDSFRYLGVAVDLLRPDALDHVLPGHLVTRFIGYPSLLALHDLTDRRYLASMGPLFGVSGMGYLAWFLWSSTTQSLPSRRRVVLVVASLALLATSNRFLYMMFYLNGHIEVAVFLLVAVSAIWLAVTLDEKAWAIPAGLALGVTVLFRPEMTLVALIILVSVAASRATMAVRIRLVVPLAVSTVVWYGIILWNHGAKGNEVSLTAPVFSGLVLVGLGIAGVLLGELKALRGVARYADIAMLVVMTVALGVLIAIEPTVFVDSFTATFHNLTRDGLWLFTWFGLLLLLPFGLVVARIPDGRLWSAPIMGFALAFWLLPLIREGAWRVGQGDSGNRILSHFVAIVVAFLVLAAAEWPARHNEDSPAPTR
jgi:hypothetical protein